MTQKKFVDAITDLDADIIEKYFTIKNEIKKEIITNITLV